MKIFEKSRINSNANNFTYLKKWTNTNFISTKFSHKLHFFQTKIKNPLFSIRTNSDHDKRRTTFAQNATSEIFANARFAIGDVHVYPRVRTSGHTARIHHCPKTESAIETWIAIGAQIQCAADNWPGTKCASEMRRDAFRNEHYFSIREVVLSRLWQMLYEWTSQIRVLVMISKKKS